MIYKNVLIERDEKDLQIKNPVYVLLNHNPSNLLGKAIAYYDNGLLFADIEVKEMNGLYPSIAFMGNKLLAIGLHASPNVDNEIKPIQ